MDEKVDTVQWYEIDGIVKQGGLLVDVREPIEREMGFIEGSINVPLGEIRDRLVKFPKDQTIYVSCQVGLRGYLAARILSENGFMVKNLDGGCKTYSSVFSQVTNVEPPADNNFVVSIEIDATGLMCPGPIIEVHKNMKKL